MGRKFFIRQAVAFDHSLNASDRKLRGALTVKDVWREGHMRFLKGKHIGHKLHSLLDKLKRMRT